MKKYDYHVEHIGNTEEDIQEKMQAALDAFAEEGWRLKQVIDSVNILPQGKEVEVPSHDDSNPNVIGDGYIIFEREAQDQITK